jgi:hypothetical protein
MNQALYAHMNNKRKMKKKLKKRRTLAKLEHNPEEREPNKEDTKECHMKNG